MTDEEVYKIMEGMDEVRRGDVSGKSQTTGSVELLQELMDACSPYLRRKKMTPRHECNALNEVWAKCAEHLEKQNVNSEPR